jgi:hypothetical protein
MTLGDRQDYHRANLASMIHEVLTVSWASQSFHRTAKWARNRAANLEEVRMCDFSKHDMTFRDSPDGEHGTKQSRGGKAQNIGARARARARIHPPGAS